MIREINRSAPSGYPVIAVLVIAQVGFAYALVRAVMAASFPGAALAVVASLLVVFLWVGRWRRQRKN